MERVFVGSATGGIANDGVLLLAAPSCGAVTARGMRNALRGDLAPAAILPPGRHGINSNREPAMKFLCALSGHVAAPVSVANQGFQFSRCARCRHDMIRSTASIEAKWKPVPEGFRVDWRATDLAAFDHKPRAAQRVLAMTTGVALIASAIRIGVSVLLWRMVDTLRGSDRYARRARDAAGRVIRVAQPKPNWNVSVQISVGREGDPICQP